ncbi:MAG TPA: 1-deoxy-D-xylulose-5-phosphate reductoisomerase [Desulfomonilaceae bacterium]|nr:1-deoxy-D-xylulose-5-phosphate reductoisomerase [Desulfomonilaceae bacterium]
MKVISILGSTGSIGVQALEIVRLHPDLFKVASLAAGSNTRLLEQQIREFKPTLVSCVDSKTADELKRRLRDYSPPLRIEHSIEGTIRAATIPDAQLVVAGLPGSTGLIPTFSAVEAGKDVALATKEVLVMAGGLFMERARKKGVQLLPVDSEQSAIFQCLQGSGEAEIRRIILTASGGPFLDLPSAALADVTRDQALNHPRWKMGPKVTIDSATLMNKGFEVIEARWLFDVPGTKIEVVIHPQSIVHSMVEFADGSILSQLGPTDMRLPISYALAFPRRIESGAAPVSFPKIGSLTFMSPDYDRFPLLQAAFSVLEQEGTGPAIVLNAADEVAVELFLQGKIPFSKIAWIVQESLQSIPSASPGTLEEIMNFHEEIVEQVRSRWAS